MYIVVDENPTLPYMVELDMTVVAHNFTHMKKVLAAYLDHGIVLPDRGDVAPKSLTQDVFGQQKSSYRDLQTQTPQFIKMVNKLLEWQIVPQRQEFRGDTPMTW